MFFFLLSISVLCDDGSDVARFGGRGGERGKLIFPPQLGQRPKSYPCLGNVGR